MAINYCYKIWVLGFEIPQNKDNLMYLSLRKRSRNRCDFNVERKNSSKFQSYFQQKIHTKMFIWVLENEFWRFVITFGYILSCLLVFRTTSFALNDRKVGVSFQILNIWRTYFQCNNSQCNFTLKSCSRVDFNQINKDIFKKYIFKLYLWQKLRKRYQNCLLKMITYRCPPCWIDLTTDRYHFQWTAWCHFCSN